MSIQYKSVLKLLTTLLLLAVNFPCVRADERLLGSWIGQYSGTSLSLSFISDNQLVCNGESAYYSASNGKLTTYSNVGVAQYVYRFDGGALVISDQQGVQVRYQKKPAAQSAQEDAQLRQLLLSSSWCSFSFSGGSTYESSWGRSSSKKVTFYTDGTYSVKKRGEGGGSYDQVGSYASQRRSGDTGRWMIKDGQYFVSQGSGPLIPMDLKVTVNSSGYPIVKSNGVEYSRCN